MRSVLRHDASGIVTSRPPCIESVPPLAQERDALLDEYFDEITLERVVEGEGWKQITACQAVRLTASAVNYHCAAPRRAAPVDALPPRSPSPSGLPSRLRSATTMRSPAIDEEARLVLQCRRRSVLR
ncbi:MAG TPA: hypothetical protein VN428_04615, partial [Bryobacteraceae bacterium]|nr:hypothetical protein [Bryobacteraceae bacterium]